MTMQLTTPRGEQLAASAIPWDCYPRPQMRREAWLNLNGSWDFSCQSYSGKIRLPFCPESPLSGIGQHFDEGAPLHYRRTVKVPQDFRKDRVLLHIGAADQHLEAFVNDTCVGSHHGGYEAMTFDITQALTEGENEIHLICRDDLGDLTMPYGKQVTPQKRGGMWYTPVSGIWQTVWLESVPQTYIRDLTMENRGYAVTIDIGQDIPGRVVVPELGEFPLSAGKVTIAPENPHLWSPEDPYLYACTVEAGEDRVESYFAIRSLEIKQIGAYPRLCLNGKPCFFHGLLDQGYWPDGIFTPAAPECYADDILAMKALGFNTLRKHIKVEAQEFYYQCDRLGMLVWQDMVNNGAYDYFRDTALPTAGVQWFPDRLLHRDPKGREMFCTAAAAAVRQLKSHPSICLWTIFNEGWGQFSSNRICTWMRTQDDTRFIDATSGWFRRRNTDVDSRHVYFRRIHLRGNRRKPLILSEFGGKTYRAEGHIFQPDHVYGYGACEDLDTLNETVARLYTDEVLPCVEQGLCASIYTQVSDVEDEINGVVTYDRRLVKLRPEAMLPIARALEEKMVALSKKME